MRGLIVTIGLMLTVLSLEAAVLPAGSKPYGKTYGQWSAAWWQWALSQPVAGHPFVDDPSFNVATGQSGSVWFLATPFGTVERQIRVPAGKSLLIGMLNTEASDLESLGATEAERRNTANFLANHIVNSSCTINGVAISNLNSYRVTSPEFNFEAPSPWIFGATGGAGVTVSDGYFVMLTPISAGSLTIHITGAFHFSVQEGDPFDFDAAADVTYHVTAH
ncbi:MAG: hypothetical protein JWM16_1390 [Verrucomicrobiales bacterium]|nr:hypothetical protein [Verrucomicrobiales bacterium]